MVLASDVTEEAASMEDRQNIVVGRHAVVWCN
jgi:hypothetical protein